MQNCRNAHVKSPSLTFQLNEKLSKDDLQKKNVILLAIQLRPILFYFMPKSVAQQDESVRCTVGCLFK